jgi:hypothetical protein
VFEIVINFECYTQFLLHVNSVSEFWHSNLAIHLVEKGVPLIHSHQVIVSRLIVDLAARRMLNSAKGLLIMFQIQGLMRR